MIHKNNLQVHHIGYCVKNIFDSIIDFQSLNYEKQGDIIEDIKRNVSIQFMINNSTLIELISPLNSNEKSPVDNYLNKNGCTPYHICYFTDNMTQTLNNLKKNKYIIIEKPNSAVAFNQNYVAFLFKKDVGIIEVVELK